MIGSCVELVYLLLIQDGTVSWDKVEEAVAFIKVTQGDTDMY